MGNQNRSSELKFMSRNADFKIVLLYEDLAAGLRGSTVLKRLAGQLEMDSDQLDTDIWKFELLLFQPEILEQVTFQIMWANLIVVSSASNANLPSHVKDCLERALALRQNRDAAIVALPGNQQMATSEMPHTGAYLCRLAQEFGLQFLLDKEEWPPRIKPDHIPAALEIEGDFAVSWEVVPRDSGGRDWGIND